MLSHLIKKELLNALYQPRWIAGILIFTTLLSISLISGTLVYQDEFDRYQVANQMSEQNLREQRGWSSASKTEFVPPNPLAIYSGGVNYDIGQSSTLSSSSTVQLTRSYYNKNLLIALFRIIDFGTIITLIGSLLAILFAYDSISGEREQGTLKMLAAYDIPRYHIFIAKVVAGTLILLFPVIVAFLIQAISQQLLGVHFDSSTWAKIALIFVSSLLFLGFFVSLSVTISSYTRQSSASFLSLLVIWVVSSLIIPRLGILAASHIIEVPSVAELESRKSTFEKDQWDAHSKDMGDTWRQRSQEMSAISGPDAELQQQKLRESWNAADEQKRNDLRQRVTENAIRLDEEADNMRHAQEELGLQLSLISPSSMYHLLLMDISETGLSAKNAIIEQLRTHRNAFLSFTERKNQESGGKRSGFFNITFDSDTGISIDTEQGRKAGLDISEMPRFNLQRASVATIFSESLVNMGALIVFWMISLFVGILGFVRYDVR